MPEKNVATTTTGMLMLGNRSTGMRTRLVMPITAVIRQVTMTKYGKRIAKRDMDGAWRLVAVAGEKPLEPVRAEIR